MRDARQADRREGDLRPRTTVARARQYRIRSLALATGRPLHRCAGSVGLSQPGTTSEAGKGLGADHRPEGPFTRCSPPRGEAARAHATSTTRRPVPTPSSFRPGAASRVNTTSRAEPGSSAPANRSKGSCVTGLARRRNPCCRGRTGSRKRQLTSQAYKWIGAGICGQTDVRSGTITQAWPSHRKSGIHSSPFSSWVTATAQPSLH